MDQLNPSEPPLNWNDSRTPLSEKGVATSTSKLIEYLEIALPLSPAAPNVFSIRPLPSRRPAEKLEVWDARKLPVLSLTLRSKSANAALGVALAPPEHP